MIYGYEQPIQLPTLDLYDKSIMAMALNAAKDMYDRGYLEMKDFQKTYGDFMTPIMADLDWYDLNVTGKVRDAVNALYAQGIDPLRNALGRAAISLLINNMPYGEIAKKRIRAKNAEEYYKNMAILQRENKYNKKFSEYLGEDPNMWTSNSAGVTSPTAFQGMDDMIEPIVKNLEPMFDAELTAAKNDGYNYSTVSKDRILAAIDDNMEDLLATPSGGYYYSKAYEATGDKEKAKSLLKEWYANRASDHVTTKREADPYKLDNVRTLNDNWLDAQKTARDNYSTLYLAGADENLDGKISKDEYKKYADSYKDTKMKSGSKGDSYDNIFREADTNVLNLSGVDYVRANAYYLKIQPRDSGITHTVNKDGSTYYTIPAGQVDKILYTHDSIYDTESNRLSRHANFQQKTGNYYFRPTGQIKAKFIVDSKGKVHKRYFISGTLLHLDFDTDITDNNGSPKIYEMEVIERDHNYGKKQEKN